MTNDGSEPPVGLATIPPRIDPIHDRRRLILYFGGLIAFYGLSLVIARPAIGGGEAQLQKVVIQLMFAPTFGALLAVVFGPGVIRIGGASKWLLVSFVPPVAVFGVTVVAGALGLVDMHAERLLGMALLAIPASLSGCVSAIGEEIGWRGFLWPLLRRRQTFVKTSVVMFAVWWVYHAPLVLAGLYGQIVGLPAFTVALVGFVLFVGVLTERSRSVWPSVLAHGSWNGLVATQFASDVAGKDQSFTGGAHLLGEFGWLAAVVMLAVGVLFARWHMATPMRDGLSPSGPTGYDSPVLSRWRGDRPLGTRTRRQPQAA